MDLICDIVRDFVNRSREELGLLERGLADWIANPDDPERLTSLAEIPRNLREMSSLLGVSDLDRVLDETFRRLQAMRKQWPQPGLFEVAELLPLIGECSQQLNVLESGPAGGSDLPTPAEKNAKKKSRRKRLVPACPTPSLHTSRETVSPSETIPPRESVEPKEKATPRNSLTDFIVKNLADGSEQTSGSSPQMGERIVRLIDEVMTARHQIRQIFAHAVSLTSPKERSQFLGQACASCPELQTSLERLLKSESQSQKLLQFPASELIRALLESLRVEEQPVELPPPPMVLSTPESKVTNEDLESTVHVRPNTAFVAVSSTPTSSDPAALPRAFGRYTLERQLGQGAMGTVYLAGDRLLNRQVALKLLKVKPDDGPELVERFYREARSMASLQHANLCPIYDFGEVDGQPYLTMAFISGRPLSEHLVDGQPLETQYAVTLVRTLATALFQAHQMGIVHRDLKPANVMINQQGEPILMDFGLARRQQPGEAEITQQGMILGSPAYMSPEQVEGNTKEIGPATDIHALGVILYELLSGHKPFDGTVASVLAQIHSKEAAPLVVTEDSENQLDAICRKAMAKSIQQRFATAVEFANALGEYLDGVPRTRTASETSDTKVESEPIAETSSVEIDSGSFLQSTLSKLASDSPEMREKRWRWAAVTAALIGITAMTINLVAQNSTGAPAPKTSSATTQQPQ